MRNILFGAATALLFLSKTCEAGLLLTLSHNAPDLNNLSVGQLVQFDVTLSGLGDPGNPTELSNLNVDVSFSGSLFGTPSLVSAGPIVPDPTDTFTAVSNVGVAGAIFDNIFLPPPSVTITTNGIFVSFQVTALSAGSGTVSFEPPSSGFDQNNDPISVDGAGFLSFQIVSGGGVVPEPSTGVLLAIGLVVTGLLSRTAAQRGRRNDLVIERARLG